MLINHKEAPLSTCCEFHFRAAYTISPPIDLNCLGFRRYEYVFLVENSSEARRLADSLCISKDDFRYCQNEKELVGYRLPTEKQLFISRRLNTTDNYLHKRFSRIVRPDLTIVKPHLKPYPIHE